MSDTAAATPTTPGTESPGDDNGAKRLWGHVVRLVTTQEATGIPPGSIRYRRPRRVGNTLPLLTLAPEYRPERHRVYVDLLERALRHPDTRSIALTGAYGSGKSSVLRALRRKWWNPRVVVELSLSTLDPELEPVVAATNPAERATSNRIQKEIVKQLLYRLPPRRTPHSRFPRATRPAFLSGVAVALAAAALVGLLWIVATFAGWQAALEERLAAIGWSTQAFWGGVTVTAVVLALLAWWTLSGRYAVQAGVKTGALTLSLEPSSSSYFDQYLDEIMYFFQVSKARLVLIEDVDRFSDATVLDTLRALNHLVNNSRQVGRRVVFIYAIRDSVLGHVGPGRKAEDADTVEGTSHESDSSLQLDRANRAKYFDVIIPIVPFVTSDNARDLMLDVMRPHVAEAPGQPGISPALIRLVARHVADMRTLRSIRNEFEVHADRLITSATNAMPEITPDIVLALVLLRATSPMTFENIRLSTSNLDKLVRRWIDLVEANLEAQTENVTALETQIDNGLATSGRARRAGRALSALRPELLTMSRYSGIEQVEFAGPLSNDDLGDVEGWRRIANGEPLVLALGPRPGRGGPSDQIHLSAQLLSRLIKLPIDPASWRTADIAELRDQVTAAEDEIAFLRHHTWQQLYARTDLTVAAEAEEAASLLQDETDDDDAAEGREISFADLVQLYAPSALCRDLIQHGYLPRHFARYSSMFYGEVVGLNATEYISRAIEPGVPIIEYELNEDAVGQILDEQGAHEDAADLFEDPSVYNLDIVSFLLAKRPAAAARVAGQLARKWGDVERKFVGRFFQREGDAAPATLARLMAPSWKDAVKYTAVEATLAPERRMRLLDAVLAAIPAGERTDLDSEVGQFLSNHFAELSAVSAPPSKERADITMKVVSASAGSIAELRKLNPHALASASELSVYPVTTANLDALRSDGSISLDVLQDEREPVYRHLLGSLEAYLDALEELEPPVAPVADPETFVTVLNDIATGAEQATLTRFIGATSVDCRVADLEDAETEAWPDLVALRRTAPTFSNVQRYVAEHGVDDALGAFLVESTEIQTPDSTPVADRLALAITVLRASAFIPYVPDRVGLVQSLAPGLIPIANIRPDDAALVGPLIAAGLLSDVKETFSPTLLSRWEDLEAAIAASDQFVDFVDSTTLPPRHLAAALRSTAIGDDVVAKLIDDLDTQLDGVTAADATAVTFALCAAEVELDGVKLEALRGAGASTTAMVGLLRSQGERLPLSDLTTVLAGMGGDYQRLAAGGSGKVRFDIDEDHKALLTRLESVTHTGAEENYTKTHGLKLEANLKQPSA